MEGIKNWEIIGLYKKYIFSKNSGGNRFDSGILHHRVGGIPLVKFHGIWDGTQEEFISKHKKEFPNSRIEIFKHTKKPMSSFFRFGVEHFISKDSEFKIFNRDEIINDILNECVD